MHFADTVLGLSLLIVLHELGHYGVARLCGMRVLRFSVGFGPTLAKKQLGDTIWQIALVPLGGYVHIHGMGADEPVGNDGKSYREKPLWMRALVVFAGPLANWLTAALAIAGLAASVGFTQYDESVARLGDLSPDGAAVSAGLVTGDLVRSVAGVAVSDWDSLVREVRKHPEQAVPFVLMRDGRELSIVVRPARAKDSGLGAIGAAPYGELVRYAPADALTAGVQGAWRLTTRQAALLWGIVTGSKEGGLLGLPKIIQVVSAEAKRGLSYLLESLALLSIGLCLLNLLPVPALDGSRLVFLGIEAVRGKPVNQLIEGWVHALGFVLLFGVWIFISVRELL